MTRQHACPGCGEIVPSIWASIVHCDPNEPIDDITDDNPGIIRSSD